MTEKFDWILWKAENEMMEEKIQNCITGLVKYELDPTAMNETAQLEIDEDRKKELVEETIQYVKEDVGDNVDGLYYTIKLLLEAVINRSCMITEWDDEE